MRQQVSVVLIAGIATLVASCTSAPRRTREGGPTDQGEQPKYDVMAPVEGQGGAEYRDIQKIYAAGQFESALNRLTVFEKKYPKSTLLGHVRNLRGLIYLQTKRPLQAIFHFKKALEKNDNASFRQFVLYNLAAAQTEAGQLEEAQASLAEVRPETLDTETRMKYHNLRSRLFTRRGLHLESARELLALSRLVNGQPLAPFGKKLDENLASITDPVALEKVYREFEDAPLADLVLFRLGQQELALGRPGAGESRLKELMSRYPQTPHYAEASELVKSVQDRTVVDTKSLGVLLPMKGKFGKFGTRALQAIELAFRIFNQDETDSKIQLVIEDSGEEADQAVKALNRLYFKHHVAAVIGPLLSKGIEQVTLRAQELGLPLVTLSQQPGVTGDFVFQSGLTPQLQAREIARYAIEKMGLKKFAIVYPRDKFGEQYSQSYWDAVEELGGQVVGAESYTPGETDFRQVVDRLSGLSYPEARQRELDVLAKKREEDKIKKRTRKTEQYFALKPIVDYEAVFIPDEPKIVGQILPTFAYRDVDKVQFLGTATWNSTDLISRAKDSAENSVFVDAFYADSTRPEVRKFVEKYKETFGQDPAAIEALAYDAAHILESIMGSNGGSEPTIASREEIRNRLQSVARFPGVTGKISQHNGLMQRDLTLLTIKSGAIQLASP